MPESDIEDVDTNGPPTGELRLDDTAQVPLTPPTDLDSLFADEDDAWPSRTEEGLSRHVAHCRIARPFGGIGRNLGRCLHATSHVVHVDARPRRCSRARSDEMARVPAGRSPFASAAAANATSGTVTDIIGNTLYVTNSSGNLVSVTIGPSTTIDRNAKSTLSALQPGDTVTVQGTKSADGTVAAASVSATQAGVTAGGFGGFGGFGGAAAASAGG